MASLVMMTQPLTISWTTMNKMSILTGSFYPGEATAPYHGGEQIEMQHVKSGLPDSSYDKQTPLLRRAGSISDLQYESDMRKKLKRSVVWIKDRFPKADFRKMTIRRGRGENEGKIIAVVVK